MSDLISRCELFNRLAPVQTLGEAYGIIQEMPTVDAVPVVHGEWVREKYPEGGWYYKCSHCDTEPLRDKWTKHEVLSDWCPWCGADMRERREQDDS